MKCRVTIVCESDQHFAKSTKDAQRECEEMYKAFVAYLNSLTIGRDFNESISLEKVELLEG